MKERKKSGSGSVVNNVVISGVSGRFPASNSFEELKKNLFNKFDMVIADDTRWPVGKYRGLHCNIMSELLKTPTPNRRPDQHLIRSGCYFLSKFFYDLNMMMNPYELFSPFTPRR